MKRFLLRLTGEVLTSIAKDRLVTWDGSVNMREIMARLSDTPMLWISRWFMKRKVLFIGDGALCWRRPVSQIREAWMGRLCTDPSLEGSLSRRSYHCWMESNQTNPEQLSKHEIRNCEEWDDGGSSFSASFMSKSQDISFGAGSPTCDAQFPCFECSANMADVNAIAGGMLKAFYFNRLYYFLASWSDLVSKFSQKQTWEDYFCYKILLFELDVMLKKWITSKRNRTIEHGECEQLDLMVIESVIRWSSCTQLPTSFRSSLLC
ncbi:hypothetical protein JHK87_025132 [Glycine soja]|nr:hypothetical protein JHK87_025132 [Glycine soja]